jgi:hypothetical protein
MLTPAQFATQSATHFDLELTDNAGQLAVGG